MNFHHMTDRYNWQDKYEAAILETNPEQLMARMIAAQNAINTRLRELRADDNGTPEERRALMNAIFELRTLRDKVS
jgi:hypothetical protein